jgi:queuine/archaeosine tRNA-ribosyltransferase
MYITKKSERSFLVETNGKSIETPFFVAAVSSIKANWTILQYLDLLEKLGYPAFLISAYDLCKLPRDNEADFEKLLSQYSNKSTFFFLDNGNYEAYWYKDQKWNLDGLKAALDKACPDFCFSFDVFWTKGANIEAQIKETVTSIAKTAGMQKLGATIALLHSEPKLFAKITRKVVDNINPEFVAVPERELGSSIFERAQTIKNIRSELDKTDKLIPLHILGTGNPLSILIYTLCGADTYDALDWSSAFIDPKTGQYYHFSQKDLSTCNCEACRMKNVPYDYQVMAHNLIFYRSFLDKIRNSLEAGKINTMLAEYFSKGNSEIKEITGLK